jgi:hypothetical protein
MHPILCVRFKRSDTGTLHLYMIILSPELRTHLIDYESIIDLGPNKNRVLYNSTMASSGDNKKHHDVAVSVAVQNAGCGVQSVASKVLERTLPMSIWSL